MKVKYVTHMGDDLLVVNAARVSFSKQSWWANEEEWLEFDHDLELKESDAKLIKYLATHKHWTPMAHPHICLHVEAPIPIRTQCFKHKQGFVENEVSRRYVDDDPTFYMPIFRQRAEDKKQGSRDEFPVNLEKVEMLYNSVLSVSEWVYKELIKEGVAPEQARFSLVQGAETEWYWTGSLAAYARFYKQRSDPHAQQEIQELAKMVDAIIEPLFPVSWAALTAEGISSE